MSSQHYEEVELVFYWGWELVVLVIISVLGSLYYGISWVVVEYAANVGEQNLEKVVGCLVETCGKDEWA
jgi:hypothetical protein